MTLRNILLAGTALGAAALLASPAFAGSAAATQNEIDTMKQQIMELQQRLDDLQIAQGNEIKEIKEKQDAVQLDFKDGKPTFRTGDGLFTMSIRGRAHLDVARYNQDSESKAATGGGLNSGANFRRAELGVEGTFMRDWGYYTNFQFGDSGRERAGIIKESYLSYNGIDGISLVAGAVKTPVTIDDTTSSNDITFIERSAAANMHVSLGAGDGRVAFGGRGHTGDFYYSLFYSMNTVNTSDNTSSEGSAVVGRTAYHFEPMENTNVHLGASGTFKFDPDGPVRFRDRPELRVDPTRLTDTGDIAADSAYVFGPEFAANYGPFKVQGEYYYFKVNRSDGLSDPDFNSWYVQGSWVLTGEKYKYSMSKAAYSGVKPASPFTLGGGIGAWEIATRYSQTDLDYKAGSAGFATPAGGIRGGEQDIITVGLNWYPINNVRMMFEYLNVDIDRLNAAGADVSHNYDAVAARFQYAF